MVELGLTLWLTCFCLISIPRITATPSKIRSTFNNLEGKAPCVGLIIAYGLIYRHTGSLCFYLDILTRQLDFSVIIYSNL